MIEKKPVGRPTKYSKEIAEEIAERLGRGEPLARICEDGHIPDYSTVRRWESENPEFQAISTRAKIDGTHFLADDCLRIADDLAIDPANKRIMVDTRLRLIGKWNTRVYGEKVSQEHTGTVTLAGLVEASIPKLTDAQKN